ncbi:hypothetical protein BLNAU_4461 [Blattamonas nauphoetae]|uniref:Uncharacterized protein n=1 Tax=Blattamonas nauphoetae TaxID=2049346 RepID=A0ABQ9YA41_9EUKA|nr:hypothetical protein BLNAU_4461 [Blattamonas nauphoetae]
MSAHADAQGLFYTDTQASKPIRGTPIFSFSTNEDFLQGRKTCKSEIKKEMEKVLSSSEWKQKATESSTLLADLTKAGGFDYPLTLENISSIGDPIFCANHAKRTECLLNTDLDAKAIELHKWTNQQEYKPGLDRVAKLRISSFMNEILNVTANTLKKKKTFYRFYSAHDGNLLSLLQLFRLESPGLVPFASAFVFELHKTNAAATRPFAEADVGFKLKYFPYDQLNFDDELARGSFYDRSDEVSMAWNTENGDITKSVCKTDYCTMAQLRAMVYTNDEWKKECGLIKPPKSLIPVWLVILTIVLSVLLIAVTALLVIALIKIARRPKSSQYDSLINS